LAFSESLATLCSSYRTWCNSEIFRQVHLCHDPPKFFSWNVQSVKDLKLSCCFFSVKLFGFLKADAGMAGLARLNLNGFLKILTFVSSQAPLIYLTPQFRFLQQVYILATLKFRYCEKPINMYLYKSLTFPGSFS
jgi:hypothetical protein